MSILRRIAFELAGWYFIMPRIGWIVGFEEMLTLKWEWNMGYSRGIIVQSILQWNFALEYVSLRWIFKMAFSVTCLHRTVGVLWVRYSGGIEWSWQVWGDLCEWWRWEVQFLTENPIYLIKGRDDTFMRNQSVGNMGDSWWCWSLI